MVRILLRSRLAWISVIFGLYLVVCLLQIDPDFGWHLASGNYFLAHGIPATDIYSYTAPTFPWIDHEWLSDVIVARLYSFGGYGLLAFLAALLWTIGVWLAGRSVHPVLLFIAVLATLPSAGVRTTVWSVVFLAVTMYILQRPRFWLLIVVPVFLLWVNLHASFIVGFIVVGYEAIRRRSWKLGLLLLGCIGVSFINPFGWHLYEEVWRTLSDSRLHWQIVEWATAGLPLMSLPYVLAWIGTFVVKDGKNPWAYPKLDVLALLAALSSARNISLFVVLSLRPLWERIQSVTAQIPHDLDKSQIRVMRSIGVVLSIVIVLTVIVTFRNISLNRESPYPAQSVAVLATTPCEGNLFNDYDYGGYLIWKLPEVKVYIDGRMASWQHGSIRYLDDYSRILTDTAFRREQFEKYDVRCVLVRLKHGPFISALIKDGWTGRYYPDGSALLRAK